MSWRIDVATLLKAAEDMRRTHGPDDDKHAMWGWMATVLETEAEMVSAANQRRQDPMPARPVDADLLALASTYLAVCPAPAQPMPPLVDPTHNDPRKVRLAWHDVTCPEGEECRSRELHGNSGLARNIVPQFLERLGARW
jgi:hypothetical protein